MDPRRLALRQVELDRQRTERYPTLLTRKQERMSASPLAFLRGAAPLFYELLAQDRDLAAGPEGYGFIQGDAHLENFGAYSPAIHDASGWKKGHAVFQLNDFDEATRGAWRWDALRLTTSLLLAGRELGQSGPRVLELCELLLDAYAAAAHGQDFLPVVPRPVSALIARVDARSPKKMLDDRTEISGGRRRFVRSDRYNELSSEMARAVPTALALFAERSAAQGGPRLDQLELLDVAFRIAGTGSLGSFRIAALTRGKGAIDSHWLFDLKEEAACSVDVLAPRAPSPSRAAEVETACRACLEYPPRMLGTSQLAGMALLVRRLTPQEDKLSLSRLAAEDLAPVARYLGALLGAAHFHGREGDFARWSSADRAGLLRRAVTLAGVHEAVYLELCQLALELPTLKKKP